MRNFDCIAKALAWCIGNLLIGSVPLWLLIGLTRISKDVNQINFLSGKLAESLKDGAIMFFCLALTGSAMIDFILSKCSSLVKRWILIGIVLSPMGMLALLVFLNTNLYYNYHAPQNIDFELYNYFQKILIVFTSVYCLIVKTFLFLKEKEVEYGN
jgi:hypothetical protein